MVFRLIIAVSSIMTIVKDLTGLVAWGSSTNDPVQGHL